MFWRRGQLGCLARPLSISVGVALVWVHCGCFIFSALAGRLFPIFATMSF